MTSSEKIALVHQYFSLMTDGNIPAIISLFETGAIIQSPFLGEVEAGAFFSTLGDASGSSKLTVFDVLLSEAHQSAAAHFEYDWTLKSGERFVFQGIDYFRFGAEGRFSGMSIFYDTHPVRHAVGDKYRRD